MCAQTETSTTTNNNAQAGRKFRGLVKFHNETPTIRTLTMREIGGREIVVRVEAAQTCYTSVQAILEPNSPGEIPFPDIGCTVGHGGVGIVEAVGPHVISIKIGDRVLVNLHPACGRCYNCLNQRSDKCVNMGFMAEGDLGPTCFTEDGRPVITHLGGMAELMITNEEHATPIFSEVDAGEIAMLTCVGGCGLGMSMTNCPVEVASDVVVFGAGPVGLSAIQGAKIKGASKIIAVEPIPYRREIALALGATDVVDPNQYTERRRLPGAVGAFMDYYEDSLVTHLRDMTKPHTSRFMAGGGRNGPHHVIEAVGGDLIKPASLPQGPDPTGVTVLKQAWELCSAIGTLTTCSYGHPHGAEVSFPATRWADGSKHHWPGTGGGTNDRRDTPRYIRLMETGQLDMKTLAARTYKLDQVIEAYQACGDREYVATIVTPNA